MQLPVYFFSQRAADAFHMLQFVNAGSKYAFQTPESRKKALTTLGANSGNVLEARTGARFSKFGPMTIYRETMSFIANLLDQM
jgi:hypothetical protein